MLDIIKMAQTKVHVAVEQGIRPPETEEEDQNQVLYQVGSKRRVRPSSTHLTFEAT